MHILGAFEENLFCCMSAFIMNLLSLKSIILGWQTASANNSNIMTVYDVSNTQKSELVRKPCSLKCIHREFLT